MKGSRSLNRWEEDDTAIIPTKNNDDFTCIHSPGRDV
jgi:hypothetical protein